MPLCVMLNINITRRIFAGICVFAISVTVTNGQAMTTAGVNPVTPQATPAANGATINNLYLQILVQQLFRDSVLTQGGNGYPVFLSHGQKYIGIPIPSTPEMNNPAQPQQANPILVLPLNPASSPFGALPTTPLSPPASPFSPPASPYSPPASPYSPTASPFSPPASPTLPFAPPTIPPASPTIPPASPTIPPASPLSPPASPFSPPASPFSPPAPPFGPMAPPSNPMSPPAAFPSPSQPGDSDPFKGISPEEIIRRAEELQPNMANNQTGAETMSEAFKNRTESNDFRSSAAMRPTEYMNQAPYPYTKSESSNSSSPSTPAAKASEYENRAWSYSNFYSNSKTSTVPPPKSESSTTEVPSKVSTARPAEESKDTKRPVTAKHYNSEPSPRKASSEAEPKSTFDMTPVAKSAGSALQGLAGQDRPIL